MVIEALAFTISKQLEVVRFIGKLLNYHDKFPQNPSKIGVLQYCQKDCLS